MGLFPPFDPFSGLLIYWEAPTPYFTEHTGYGKPAHQKSDPYFFLFDQI
jgi:hypothetical protein